MQYALKDLEGALLDAAMAKADGYSNVRITEFEDRTVCEVEFDAGGGRYVWVTHTPTWPRDVSAMRAYVASKLGDTVELP
jgi:hypothetical protein